MEAEKLLKHMAWANREILTQVAAMPDEALDSYAANPEWTVREIARHIVSSATWYGWRLLDWKNFTEAESVNWQEKLDATEERPANAEGLTKLIERLAEADSVLLEAGAQPEGVVHREVDGELITRARSTIISQAIHHATEHRAQLVSALEARGYTTINLDDYDLWSYADTIGE